MSEIANLKREIADLRRPQHWDRMSWARRDEWLTWVARRVEELQPLFELYPWVTTWTMSFRGVDERGRRLWTREEQLAAARAHDVWLKADKAPELALTEDQREAYRAYGRAKDATRLGRGPASRVAQVAELDANGLTVEEIAEQLGVSPESARRYRSHARQQRRATESQTDTTTTGEENAA
jgi:hypothetical protein